MSIEKQIKQLKTVRKKILDRADQIANTGHIESRAELLDVSNNFYRTALEYDRYIRSLSEQLQFSNAINIPKVQRTPTVNPNFVQANEN